MPAPGSRRGGSGRLRPLFWLATLVLAACSAPPPLVSGPPRLPPKPVNAVAVGIRHGPSIGSLIVPSVAAGQALAAFRATCPALLSRTDTSGLTQVEDWREACSAAETAMSNMDPAAFFCRYFETAIVGDGAAFATGYYEPEIRGSRAAAPGYGVPIYRDPGDIVSVDLGLFSPELAGRKLRGRIADGRLVPYYERGEIEAGALAGRGLELAYAADPIDLFFLQVQGSGILALPDGSKMRIGYAGQNGRDYVAIGKLLRDRGALGPGQASMQGIVAWLRARPDEAKALMDENRSYVFFRELTGEGPIGALGVAVAGRVSLAADPAFMPLGAPVWLKLDRPEASGLWIAQDTGGAIKGANRFDTFWGGGEGAARTAGGLAAHGDAYLLLPRGTIDRLNRAVAPSQR